MKKALLSVSDKSGIVEFAKGLLSLGYEIISTGGTFHTLNQAGIKVIDITEVTNFPEMMGGRVKTLHPKIHGGILSIRGNTQHLDDMKNNEINFIDLVCVNLYPFKETISKSDVSFEEAIENIDIGGPSMLRSAAKNHAYVTVVSDPEDYNIILQEIKEYGETSIDTRQKLALKAFQLTAAYDALISHYFSSRLSHSFPEKLTLTFEKKKVLRYGENPHQLSAFYKNPLYEENSLAYADQIHGKELSYNNIQDGNAAIDLILEFDEPAVVALKHMNPCGVAIGNSLYDAWIKTVTADPISIFGGIIATNQIIDKETAQGMSELFLELIIAPGFTNEAISILEIKKNIRLLRLNLDKQLEKKATKISLHSVNGGVLVQTKDEGEIDFKKFNVVTYRSPTEDEQKALLFAWKIVKHVKSNAIVIAKEGQTLGIGAGQMNRVGAAKIALEQAGILADGNVLASDAFFPMPDTLELAIKYGIKAVIQPGGSIKDQASIDLANQHGIAMIFTEMRHFKH